MSQSSKTKFHVQCVVVLLAMVTASACRNEPSREGVPAADTVLADTLVPFHGVWACEKYINKLLETRSPNKAQDYGYFFRIPVSMNQSGYTYVYHEGGAEFHVVKNSTTYFIKYEGDVTDSSEIVFVGENKMRIDGVIYVKVKDKAEVPEDLLFRGNYTFNDTAVVFSEYGTISGLSSVDTYSVQNDYIGPGMDDVNIVYLGRNSEVHVFHFEQDTLFIHKMKCMEEGENGECNDIQAGELAYKLVKKK